MRKFRAYWTAKGVIPRWQLLLVYVTIVGAGVFGFASIQRSLDRGKQALREECSLQIRARAQLVQQADNLRLYLASPAGEEKTALNEFIRKLSVPQIKARLKSETVPPSCFKLIPDAKGSVR